MRQYRTVQPESLPNPAQPDFHNRLRKMLEDIDWWAQDAAFGFNRIIQGQNPDGSGDPLGGDVDGGIFFRLLGRPSGQIAHFSTGDGGTGILASTTAGVKGKIFLGNAQTSAYDEANNRLGVGTASPSATLHSSGTVQNTAVLRPAATADRGVWYTHANETGDLHLHVDESTADDNDYIYIKTGEFTHEGQFSCKLSLPIPAVLPPSTNTFTFRYRYRSTDAGTAAAGPGISGAIYKDFVYSTPVASIAVANPSASGSFTEVSVTLTATEIDRLFGVSPSGTPFANLEMLFNWSGSPAGVGSGGQMQISWAEFDCGTATSTTDAFRSDDGGIDVFPTIRHNTSWKNILATGSTNDIEQWLAADGTTVMLGVNSSGDIHGGNEAASALNLLSRSATGSPQARVQITSGPDVVFDLPSGSVDPITIGLGLATGSFTGLSLAMALNSTGGNPSTLIVNNDGGSASSVPFIVERHGSQTADLTRWRDDDGTTILSYIDKDGAFNGPIGVVTGLSTFDHILIDNALDTDVLLKMTPIVTQTANVMEVYNYQGSHIDFTIGPGGLVTVGNFTDLLSDVRFQVRAPSIQTNNIFQVVRSYTASPGPYNDLYSALTVGSGGAVVVGDLLSFGAGVIRFRINQGSGQSVDMMQVRNTADTGSFFALSSTGQLSLGDGTDTTKRLLFALNSSTAGADLTLDYRSVTDRSLIFNMSGASGTAATTLTFGTTTVARTITFPSSTSYTVAGLTVASQVWTRTQTITPTSDSTCLVLTTDYTGSTPTGIQINDSGTAVTSLAYDLVSYNGLAIQGNYSFYPVSTGVGVGFSGQIQSATLSASRIWTFPNFAGNVLVGGPTTQATGQTGNVSGNLVTAAANPDASTWLINAYLIVTTADAGGGAPNTVTVTIGWTDSAGARTSSIAQRTLTTTGSTQGTLMVQSAAANAITYATTIVPFAGGATEAYSFYIQATKLG